MPFDLKFTSLKDFFVDGIMGSFKKLLLKWNDFSSSVKNCASFLGKCYLYLNQREYISCEGQIDDVKGLAYIPDHALSEIKGMPL